MLDPVPLTIPRRVVTYRDRDLDLFGQLLQVGLPRPQPIAVASSGGGADQQPASARIASAQHLPPAPGALHDELCVVVAHPTFTSASSCATS
jgi:hypothetical protein